MKKYVSFVSGTAAAMMLLSLTGCFSAGTEIAGAKISSELTLDGKLDEPAWHKTNTYVLEHGEDQFRDLPGQIGKKFRHGVIEPGKAKVLWNDKYLYFGFELTDRDLVSESAGDQDRQDLKGDAVSVFLKPLNQTWYWEIQITPKGNRSVFFYPGRGLCTLPGCRPAKTPFKGIKAAAHAKGSLANSWDKDKKWTAEIALPRAEIGRAGEKLSPEIPWLVFFRRVNYGRKLPIVEKTCFPAAAGTNLDYFERYARLKMAGSRD